MNNFSCIEIDFIGENFRCGFKVPKFLYVLLLISLIVSVIVFIKMTFPDQKNTCFAIMTTYERQHLRMMFLTVMFNL